jgi:hypothetical protein
MNGYIAFYNGKRIELCASSSYEAQQKAAAVFKPPKSKAHMVSVMLAELDGKPVARTADF